LRNQLKLRSAVPVGWSDARHRIRVSLPAVGLLAYMAMTAMLAGCSGGEKLVAINNESEFQTKVIGSRQPVLVEFYKGG
jgi:hypothetical protein